MKDARRAKRLKGETHGDRRRAQILSAASHHFAQGGYAGTSLESISEAVGLTQPGLLHHYPTKEQLLRAVLEDRDRDDGRRLISALTRDGLEILDSLKGLVEHNQTLPGLVQLFTVLTAEAVSERHPAHNYFVDRYERIRSRQLRSLQLGQDRGEIRDDAELEKLVPLVAAAMDGLQLQWLYAPQSVDMASSFDLFTRILKAWLSEGERVGNSSPPSNH